MDPITKDIIRLLVSPKDEAARARLVAVDADNLARDGSIKTRVEAILADLAERYPDASPAVRGELALSQAAAEAQKADAEAQAGAASVEAQAASPDVSVRSAT